MFADSRLTINGWYLAVIDLKMVILNPYYNQRGCGNITKDLCEIMHQHTSRNSAYLTGSRKSQEIIIGGKCNLRD